jgi:DNA-binding NarL/FixJ family response regulator
MNEGTVKAHVSAIMRQLNVRNRFQIGRAAENAALLQAIH